MTTCRGDRSSAATLRSIGPSRSRPPSSWPRTGCPPPPAFLSDETRAQLTDELCRVGAPDVEVCKKALRPTWVTPFVRRDVTAILDTVAPPGAKEGPASALLSRYVQSSTRVLRLDPTVELLTALVAAERCNGSPAEIERCTRAVLDPSVAKVMPPRSP